MLSKLRMVNEPADAPPRQMSGKSVRRGLAVALGALCASWAGVSAVQAQTSEKASSPVVQTRETQARYIVRETGAMLYYRLTHASVDTETTGLG